MNVAYIILCHKNNKILRETVKILTVEGDVYIHVDKKSDITDFIELKNNRVNFLENRTSVHWGEASILEATLKLLEVSKSKNYDYIFLISGDDLPLKSSKKINEFLEKNKGHEFIGINKIKSKEINIHNRIRFDYNSFYFKKEKTLYEKIMSKILRKSKNRYFEDLPPLYYGCNWFGITSDARDYILKYLDDNPHYIKAFEKAFCGDELFFQTILMDSKFKDKIWKLESEFDNNLMALRYIDWKKGPDFPRTLDESDYDDILKTETLFARKFNEKIDIEKYRKIFIEEE